jgi:EmrB/QacA subfamily drug resistance transporter
MTDQSPTQAAREAPTGSQPGTEGGWGGQTVQVDPRVRTEILGAILLGLFLSALDQTIVGVALPKIVTDLQRPELYTWVVTSYLLTSTVTGPIYGKLSDLFGRRPLLLFGIGLFLVGSFLSGLSQDMFQLILFRGIQGLGAGAIFPISLAVIGDLFSPSERGKYQGLFGAVFGLSALIGPALGGFLTDNVSWHWVFFVNLPIGAVSLFIIARLMPTLRRPGASRDIDYLGAAVFTAAIVPILIGLTNKQTGQWTDPGVAGLIALGLALTAVFVLVESRAKEPIIPLGLFRNRTFTIAMIASFLASFGFFSAIVFLPLWFQVVQGSSATAAGYQLLPFLAGLIISSIASGQIVSRTGRYKWATVGSLVLLAAGLVLMTNLRADTPSPQLWAWMLVTGLGVGPSFAVFTIIVQNAVPIDKLGAATSDLTLFRQVGGTVGLTFGFTLFRGALETELPRQLTAAGVPPQFTSALGSQFDASQLTRVGSDLGARILASVPAEARAAVEPLVPALVSAIHTAISLAIANTFWLGVSAALAAAFLAAALREAPLRTTSRLRPEASPTSATSRTGEPAAAAE